MFQFLKQSITSKFAKDDNDIIRIHRRVYWIPFPKKEIIHSLSQQLNKRFKNNYYIWNISEHQYETSFFNNQVAIHQNLGYPCPPLFEVFLVSRCILNWLEKDYENVAIVHCQKNKGRSVIQLSLLLALISKEQDTYFSIKPDECFIQVIKYLNLSHSDIQPCQRLYLSYICNIFSYIPLNNASVRLVSIIFNGIPKVLENKEDGTPETNFRPQLLVIKDSQIVFDSINQDWPSYSKEDQSIIFNLNGLQIFQDTLIKCKHKQSDTLIFTVLRVMLHTAFIFNNVIRLYPKDFDKNAIQLDDNFFIDIIFERGNEKISQNAKDEQNWNDIKFSESENFEEDTKQIEGNQLIMKLYQQSKEIGQKIYCNEQNRLKVNWIPENVVPEKDKFQEIKQLKEEEQKDIQQETHQEKKKFTVQVLDDDDYYDFKVSK